MDKQDIEYLNLALEGLLKRHGDSMAEVAELVVVSSETTKANLDAGGKILLDSMGKTFSEIEGIKDDVARLRETVAKVSGALDKSMENLKATTARSSDFLKEGERFMAKASAQKPVSQTWTVIGSTAAGILISTGLLGFAIRLVVRTSFNERFQTLSYDLNLPQNWTAWAGYVGAALLGAGITLAGTFIAKSFRSRG